MFKIDLSPRRKNAKDPAGKRCEPFLKWLRTRNCILAASGGCAGKVRACHWDEAGDKGIATKVSDCWSLPMCDEHHRIQTDVLGWPKFQATYRFSAREACATYWRGWPGRAAWERRDG